MPPNRGLQPRALELIEEIRAKVHAVCGPTVSCADITTLATHDAVVAVRRRAYATIYLTHNQLSSSMSIYMYFPVYKYKDLLPLS
jgi:hypothetical protein